IRLSAQKMNHTMATRQRPSVDASPAMMTMRGSARKNAVAHQAARSPTYRRARQKNGQRHVAKKISDTRLAQPYHVEWTALKTTAVAACQTGSSIAVGVPVALKPTMTGFMRLMDPRAYSRAVPR